MKFSDYIRKQADEFRKAGDGYEALSDTSKACIDYAVQRYVDEYAAKQQVIAFGEWVDVNAVRNGFHSWTVGCGESKKDYTSEQLYNQFIEQQNKDNESDTSR